MGISKRILRRWDRIILSRYPPYYPSGWPGDDLCIACAQGPCRLSGCSKAHCGITKEVKFARETLLFCIKGASAHLNTARRLLEHAVQRLGKNYPIRIEGQEILMPLVQIICGIKPRDLSDLELALSWIEKELIRTLSLTSYGAGMDLLGLESATLHAGMLDLAGLEIGEFSQIELFSFPRSGKETHFVKFGKYLPERPSILFIGHNASLGIGIANYLKDREVDLLGLCCGGHDLARYTPSVRIIGSISDQLSCVREGIANVVVVDEQCIHADLPWEVARIGGFLLVSSEGTGIEAEDLTDMEVKKILEKVHSEGLRIGAIFDQKKAAEVAIELAQSLHKSRKDCKSCFGEPLKLRSGRGPILEEEIKSVGPSIIQGEIPGIVLLCGCPGSSEEEPIWLGERLAENGYIIISCGCTALELARGRIYERFSPNFDEGGISNLGSCLAVSHGIGSAVKIASIFLQRKLEGNFVEIADFILNRVGICVVGWGAFTQKAFATFSGANRLGVPVVVARRGFRRILRGQERSSPPLGYVHDKRRKELCWTGPVPKDLFIAVDTAGDALLGVILYTMRPNDTPSGRRKKLSNYIRLHRELRGMDPEDVSSYARSGYDIPEEFSHLFKDYRRSWVPDPTLLIS